MHPFRPPRVLPAALGRAVAAGALAALIGLGGSPFAGREGIVTDAPALASAVGQAGAAVVAGAGVPSWEIPFGGFRSPVRAIALSTTDIWGVDADRNRAGRPVTAIVRGNGRRWWTAALLPAALADIDVVDPGFGVAVGDGGASWAWDGRSWRSVGSPTDAALSAVDLWDRAHGFAVGARGAALRWDGGHWIAETVPRGLFNASFEDISATGPDEAWAVTRAGQIVRRSADGWAAASGFAAAVNGQDFLSVACQSGVRCVAAGRYIARFDGRTWRRTNDPRASYDAATWVDDGPDPVVLADGRAVRVTEGGLQALPLDAVLAAADRLRWSTLTALPGGGGPQPSALAFAAAGAGNPFAFIGALADGRLAYAWPPTTPLAAFDALPDGTVWAGGHTVTDVLAGTGPDAEWNLRLGGGRGQAATDIDLLSADDGWAVGAEVNAADPEVSDARMWRLTGSGWRPWAIDKTWRVQRLHVLATDDGWASGGNVVLRWDGASWRQLTDAPAAATLGDLSMLSGGSAPEGWFGGAGEVWHWDAVGWTRRPLPEGGTVTSLSMPSRTIGWATDQRHLFRYDGDAWRTEPLPVTDDARFVDLDAPDALNAWVLVDPDGLFHWSAGRWQRYARDPLAEFITPSRIRALRRTATTIDTDVWIVGTPATAAHFKVVEVVGRLLIPWLGR